MKRLKDFFKMIVTAVICFTMSVFSRNKAGDKVVKVLNGGQNMSENTGSKVCHTMNSNAAFGNNKNVLSGSRNNIIDFEKCKQRRRIRKVYHWKQGPGDRKDFVYEPSG